MRQHEQALLFVRKAAEDEALLAEVISSTQVSNEIFGFHVQQASKSFSRRCSPSSAFISPARTISGC
jgi:hypothetical protein